MRKDNFYYEKNIRRKKKLYYFLEFGGYWIFEEYWERFLFIIR